MAKNKEIIENIKDIGITDFVNLKYREFWNKTNQDKNAFFPEEQFSAVFRHMCWSAYKLNMKEGDIVKTTTLGGELGKYHVSGDQSIMDSIKLAATSYRRQPATRLLRGIGNMGSFPGDPGAHARYTSVQCTPLLDKIIKDMKYMETSFDEEGKEYINWVSSPLPMFLINGVDQLGQGKSCFMPERNALEIIDWLEDIENNEVPMPMSSLGCHVYYNPEKPQFIVYEIKIEKSNKKYDEITNLIPKMSVPNTIAMLKEKLPNNLGKKVIDNGGEGKLISIQVPKGCLEKDQLTKYRLMKGRTETIYIWDKKEDTMRKTNIKYVAEEWLKARKEIVKKRLESQIEETNKKIKRVDLIQEYVDKEMHNWKSEDIEKEFGSEGAYIVLSSPARAFLPENLIKNAENKKKYKKDLKQLKENLKDLKSFILNEAREIIKAQEDFFNTYE